MPTYTYRCKSCGHEFDELQKFNEQKLVRCPSCNNDTLIRVIGGGAGLVFKGSGFYKTDYGNPSPRDKKRNTSGVPTTSEKKESTPVQKTDASSGTEKKTEAKKEPSKESKSKPD